MKDMNNYPENIVSALRKEVMEITVGNRTYNEDTLLCSITVSLDRIATVLEREDSRKYAEEIRRRNTQKIRNLYRGGLIWI